MTIQSWLIYVSLVVVATSTPGPAVLFIMTNSAMYGWKRSLFAALGNISGLLILGALAVIGLGAVLKTSVLLFEILKYIGAGYLIYLGLKMILSKNGSGELGYLGDRKTCTDRSPRTVYFHALGIALSNPKAIIFLTALFPQFIQEKSPLLPQFTTLMSTLMIFSFGFLMLYAFLAHSARRWLLKPGRINILNRTSGSIFVGFGCLLASSD